MARSQGRPPTYNNEFHPKLAKNCALRGLTNRQIANELEISESTFYEWIQTHPSFSEALNSGKYEPDQQVVNALYQRSIGYKWKTKEHIKVKNGKDKEEIVQVDVEHEVPPDPVSIKFYLTNRLPGDWKDRREVEVRPDRPINIPKDLAD